MRVILTISETASKELYEALDGVPPRERAARVRLLATLGVLATRGHLPESTNGDDGSPFAPGGREGNDLEAARRSALKSQLIGSL